MTSAPDDNSELFTLCGKVRDGDITPAEFARLELWLLEDASALNTYRRFMAMCSGLEQTAVVQHSAYERDQLVAELKLPAESDVPRILRGANAEQSARQKRHREISLAVAAVATISAIILFALLRFDDTTVGSSRVFATVGSTYQPVWAGDRKLLPGKPAEAGNYSLASGAVQLIYGHGAELLVQAPARFSLHDQRRVTLDAGVVSLFIPPVATGFRIDTPFGSAIDHGTRLGVATDSESGVELHVFEGKAELVTVGATTGIMLNANQAAIIDAKSKVVSAVRADQSYFAETLEDLSDLPTVDGDIELRISPPRSVRRVRAELVDIGRATVFAERQRVEISKDLAVTLASPGRPSTVAANEATLAAGHRVDSFLVHFVLPRNRWRSDEVMTASGRIIFSRPILGVITHRLARINDDFGHPSTDYPGDHQTGLEDAIDDDASQADEIELSSDRRTLSFRLQIHGRGHAEQQDRVDQLRLLIQSKQE